MDEADQENGGASKNSFHQALQNAFRGADWAESTALQQLAALEFNIAEISYPAAQLIQQLQSSPALEAMTAIGKELERLHAPILHLHAHVAAKLDQVVAPYRNFHEKIAKDIERFRAFQLELGLRLKPVFEALPGISEEAGRFARHIAAEQKASKTIEELGFVPHEALWDCFVDQDLEGTPDKLGLALTLSEEIWPKLKPELTLSVEDCLGDPKLFNQYCDAIDAYERGRHEACTAVGVAAIERAIELARSETETKKVHTWLKSTVGKLPLSAFGGYRAYLTWQFLVEKVYRGYKSDEKANEGYYPKRNAINHGIGSRVFGSLDSINTILLTNFVIQLCETVRNFRLSEAGCIMAE